MLPLEKVKNLITRHIQIENELASGEVDKKICRYFQRILDLNEIINQAKEYLNFHRN